MMSTYKHCLNNITKVSLTIIFWGHKHHGNYYIDYDVPDDKHSVTSTNQNTALHELNSTILMLVDKTMSSMIYSILNCMVLNADTSMP